MHPCLAGGLAGPLPAAQTPPHNAPPVDLHPWPGARVPHLPALRGELPGPLVLGAVSRGIPAHEGVPPHALRLGAAARVDLRHRRPATKFPRLACRETRIEAEPQPRCRAHDGQSPPPAPVAFPWRWIGAAAVRTGDPPCPACPPLVATPCKATRGRGPCIGAAS